MKKHLNNNNNNVSLNRQVYLKTRNNYKISFENNNIRNKTEPLINKMGNHLLINIPQYFEESLQILHTIQYYVTMSAENNNKPLKKEKIIQKKKKNKGDKIKSLY